MLGLTQKEKDKRFREMLYEDKYQPIRQNVTVSPAMS